MIVSDILARELDSWAEADQIATLWWRDDDLACVTPHLSPMTDFLGEAGVPIAFAVVPMNADQTLATELQGLPDNSRFLIHGHTHTNHAAAGEKKCEFCSSRAQERCLDEIVASSNRLKSLFGPDVINCLVPPWNRINEILVTSLPDVGIRALSRFGPRHSANSAPGLLEVNTHVDLMDWRGNRRFIGCGSMVDALVAHLSARRTGKVDKSEPTGILSHHLVTQAAEWSEMAPVLRQLTDHPATRFLGAAMVFEEG